MRNAQNTDSRKIAPSEVKQWFGTSSKAQLHNSQYRKIATHLTKLHWPSDPPPPPDSPWLAKIITEPDDRWWDFRAATAAAKTLHDSIPKMLVFQEGLRWAPETRDGHGAIMRLQEALLTALPYIEWPFGFYKRSTGYKPPKAWHTYALLVAQLIIREMVVAGHAEPGITRNSVVVRVVRKALIRMLIPQAKIISSTAIGAYLTRWNKKYGLTPKGIAALTTKKALASL
jgi:hypothetical protein